MILKLIPERDKYKLHNLGDGHFELVVPLRVDVGFSLDIDEISEVFSQSFNLQPREMQCLVLYAQGKTCAYIGKRLYISVKTVESHLRKCCEKFGVDSCRELPYQAFMKGIIPMEKVEEN